MPDRDIARRLAARSAFVEAHQVADRLQWETEFSRAADEGQGRNVLGGVAAVSAGCTSWLCQKPDPLLVADRLDVDARLLR